MANSAGVRTIHPGSTARRPREIHGVPAAAGQTVGVARVISHARDLDSIAPGDVLVCRTAPPAASSVLRIVAAIVADTGGSLSSQATIARERGIPMIVAAGDATSVIRDGARLIVDADCGTVYVA